MTYQLADIGCTKKNAAYECNYGTLNLKDEVCSFENQVFIKTSNSHANESVLKRLAHVKCWDVAGGGGRDIQLRGRAVQSDVDARRHHDRDVQSGMRTLLSNPDENVKISYPTKI